MKNTILTLLFCCALSLHSQQLILDNTKENVLYTHVENRLEYSFTDEEISNILICTNNGNVTFQKNAILLTPSHPGRLTLEFFKMENNDSVHLATQHFAVKKFPNPIPTVFKKSSATISANALAVGKIELTSPLNGKYGCMPSLPVNSYKIVVYRNDKLIGEVVNTGAKNCEATIQLIQSLQPGDKVHFIDIYGPNYSKEIVLYPSLVFTIAG